MGATFVSDATGEYVLACGGTQCVDQHCTLSDYCYEWRPEIDQWTRVASLTEQR